MSEWKMMDRPRYIMVTSREYVFHNLDEKMIIDCLQRQNWYMRQERWRATSRDFIHEDNKTICKVFYEREQT